MRRSIKVRLADALWQARPVAVVKLHTTLQLPEGSGAKGHGYVAGGKSDSRGARGSIMKARGGIMRA